MTNTPETAPRVPWWVSAPLALLLSAFWAYCFVRSLHEDDPPWDPPWAAAIYRVAYGVLAVIFLGGAAAALRAKPLEDR
jgi:hypothetical protein